MYLVILNGASPIGSIYATGDNDGYASSSDPKVRDPVLQCSEVHFGNPGYLYARREKKNHTLHIPHQAIVAIYEYAKDEKPPIGFV